LQKAGKWCKNYNYLLFSGLCGNHLKARRAIFGLSFTFFQSQLANLTVIGMIALLVDQFNWLMDGNPQFFV